MQILHASKLCLTIEMTPDMRLLYKLKQQREWHLNEEAFNF